MSSPPLTHCQTSGGTPIRAVDALSSRVKTTTEIPSDAAMTKARRREARRACWATATAAPPSEAPSSDGSASEPPTITGSSGSTHGASVVSTPATNAPISSSMGSPTQTVWPEISSAVSDPVNFARAFPDGSTWTNVCCTVTPYCFFRAVDES